MVSALNVKVFRKPTVSFPNLTETKNSATWWVCMYTTYDTLGLATLFLTFKTSNTFYKFNVTVCLIKFTDEYNFRETSLIFK